MQFVHRIWILPIFAFLSIALFVIGMGAVYFMNKKAFSDLNTINETYVPVVTTTAEVRVELNNLKDLFQQIVMTNETDVLQDVEQIGHRIREKLQRIEQTIPDQASVSELSELFDHYYQNSITLTKLLKDKKFEELTAETKEVVFHRAHFEEHFDVLTKFVENLYRTKVSSTQERLDQLTSVIFAVIVLLSVIIAVGSYIVMSNITTRFNTLVSFANDIRQGNYSKQFVSPWNDEFSTVVTAFNSMARSIEESTEKLNQLANFDALTEVHNRNSLLTRLRAEISAVRRHEYALCFCMCDIDKFKLINDRFGHLTGDEVLKSFAETLSTCLRTEDVVGRYGGDEFGAILPHTKIEDAKIALERCREKFEKMIFTAENGVEFSVTGSFGIAQFDITMDDKSLVRFADDALYKSKQSGRNKITPYTP